MTTEATTTTYSWGSEISWQIVDGAGTQVCAESGFAANNGGDARTCCLPAGAYTLTCLDSYGDGWNSGYLTVNGVSYCTGFSSGSIQEESFEIFGAPPSTVPPPSAPPGAPPPALPPGAICENTCTYSGGGFCSDGGPGAEYSSCDYGYDCEVRCRPLSQFPMRGYGHVRALLS